MPEVESEPTGPGWRRWAPLLAVAAMAAWNLWSLRRSDLPVAYLNDASVHEQMVRYATKTIEAGKLPFTSWFPYVGLGSAQFLHYQSLGAVLTGLAGTVVGATTAFLGSLYLLTSLWPFVIYSSGRLFGLSRRASMVAALLSSFVVSFTGIGFERGAYSWIGGAEVWTQLLGSWALPFAWASSWRAMKDGRFLWLAGGLVALTVDLHFLSGYLAFLGIIVLALAAPGPLRRRLARAAALFATSLVAAAWVVVPLIVVSKWSAINQSLAETGYVKGYGARQELEWLFKGQLFDARRAVPVISVLVLVGVAIAVGRWRYEPLTRALVALFAASLLLSFGPTTWGPITNLVPAHADLYFRRFSMGSQLAGIYLAGTAVASAWDAWRWALSFLGAGKRLRLALVSCFVAGTLAWFAPAGAQIASYDRHDAATIDSQRRADGTDGAMIAPLVNYVKRQNDGRVYAGLSSNWGDRFLVGYVPVYKYLEGQDVEEMTYVVPTLSLMLSPEIDFDELDPSDYALFGIRYMLLPTDMSPPVPAQRIMVDGIYSLWRVGRNGYVELVQITGTLAADRADIGSRSQLFLDTLAPHEAWSVDWPGLPRPPPARAPVTSRGGALVAPGVVDSVRPDLGTGALSTQVDMAIPGTLLLSVAYDQGWRVWVDGHTAKTEMLAPAVIGISLSKGQHRVVFRYHGFGWYPELWAAGVIGLAAAFAVGRRWRP